MFLLSHNGETAVCQHQEVNKIRLYKIYLCFFIYSDLKIPAMVPIEEQSTFSFSSRFFSFSLSSCSKAYMSSWRWGESNWNSLYSPLKEMAFWQSIRLWSSKPGRGSLTRWEKQGGPPEYWNEYEDAWETIQEIKCRHYYFWPSFLHVSFWTCTYIWTGPCLLL